jgi:deoxyribose-phosphate aldolase
MALDDAGFLAIAAMLDHSMLRPEVPPEEVRAGCEQAKVYRVATVCVKPSDVPLAFSILKDSGTAVSTVIGFPHGSTTSATKVAESTEAIANGCTELDMVINIGHLRGGRTDEVQADIAAVVDAARGKAIVKVILENAYLSDEQKVVACRLATAAGAHFVKTSTGFAPSGSTAADLRLMRATVPDTVRVKAAGGIRSLDAVLEARACGAARCGATASGPILEELKARIAAGTFKLEAIGSAARATATAGAVSAIGGGY